MAVQLPVTGSRRRRHGGGVPGVPWLQKCFLEPIHQLLVRPAHASPGAEKTQEKRRRKLGEGMIKHFTGTGVGFGLFVGIGYGIGFGNGVGVGNGAPYKHRNLMFGPCMGTVLGIGVGVGRLFGVSYFDPCIDWYEVVYGNRSWGVEKRVKISK